MRSYFTGNSEENEDEEVKDNKSKETSKNNTIKTTSDIKVQEANENQEEVDKKVAVKHDLVLLVKLKVKVLKLKNESYQTLNRAFQA